MRRLLALVFASLLLAASAAADAPDLSKDLDGDGTVTKKEERQARRAARRARRGERGTGADDGGSTTEEDAARQDAAALKASSLAESLRATLPSADAGVIPPGGSGSRPAPAPAPASGAASSGDPANPRTPDDLLLAVRGGYAPALARTGLKLSPDGRGFTRVSDGKPASPQDLERLRAEVSAMPAAAARRPDFSSKVPPEHFDALRAGYRTGRAPKVYKDVGATERERDFIHSRSCAKVSGDCNAFVARDSYKKGEFVAPEDLENMYKGLAGELAASEEEEDDSPGGAARRAASIAAAAAAGKAAGPEDRVALQKAARAAVMARAYETAPSFLPPSARRVLAQAVVFLAPATGDDPALAWVCLAALGVLTMIALLAWLRRA